MTKHILTALCAALLYWPGVAAAGDQVKHRVVFDVAINDPASFKVLIKNIDSLKTAFAPEAVEVEVVAYAKGLDLYLSRDPEVLKGIQRLAAANVRFKACGITTKTRRLSASQLGEVCELVDGGLAELVRLQEQGWSYIKLSAYSQLP